MNYWTLSSVDTKTYEHGAQNYIDKIYKYSQLMNDNNIYKLLTADADIGRNEIYLLNSFHVTTTFNKWFWTIIYLFPTMWSDWNKQHINETVQILLRQTSLHSFIYSSNSGEVCLSEVYIISNTAWMFQTKRRFFKPIILLEGVVTVIHQFWLQAKKFGRYIKVSIKAIMLPIHLAGIMC